MATIIIATKNQNKAKEFAALLAPYQLEVKTLADFPTLEIVEDGTTFEENARKKAQAAVEAFNLPVLADDSGLMIDTLNGEPGVYSARYAGDHDDAANNQKVLTKLKDVPFEQRTAHFHTTIVGLKPNRDEIVVNGQVNGHILEAPQGENGFGYDPIFWVDELQVPMATLTMTEKNQISHRGRALQALMQQFKEWWD
mgnify:CR=1 FL=1